MALRKDPVSWLYPPIEPYRTGRLKVSELHELYFEESGNPTGSFEVPFTMPNATSKKMPTATPNPTPNPMMTARLTQFTSNPVVWNASPKAAAARGVIRKSSSAECSTKARTAGSLNRGPSSHMIAPGGTPRAFSR